MAQTQLTLVIADLLVLLPNRCCPKRVALNPCRILLLTCKPILELLHNTYHAVSFLSTVCTTETIVTF